MREVASAASQDLVAPGAQVEPLAGGFSFTEGPACDAQGNLFFTDIPNARIHKWSIDGKLSTFREDSGGANGRLFDRSGNLLACEGGNRRLTSIPPDGQVTVLTYRCGGKKLNSPNDRWIDPQGGVRHPESGGGGTRSSPKFPGENVHSRVCWGFTGDIGGRTVVIQTGERSAEIDWSGVAW